LPASYSFVETRKPVEAGGGRDLPKADRLLRIGKNASVDKKLSDVLVRWKRCITMQRPAQWSADVFGGKRAFPAVHSEQGSVGGRDSRVTGIKRQLNKSPKECSISEPPAEPGGTSQAWNIIPRGVPKKKEIRMNSLQKHLRETPKGGIERKGKGRTRNEDQ